MKKNSVRQCSDRESTWNRCFVHYPGAYEWVARQDPCHCAKCSLEVIDVLIICLRTPHLFSRVDLTLPTSVLALLVVNWPNRRLRIHTTNCFWMTLLLYSSQRSIMEQEKLSFYKLTFYATRGHSSTKNNTRTLRFDYSSNTGSGQNLLS